MFMKGENEAYNQEWLRSKDVQEALKIRACDLMHLRQEGKLRFEKKGNAYMYQREDVNSLKEKN